MQLGRHKSSPGRSVSEAAPHFGNLCVYEPSALRKKPSTSSEETFDSRKKHSDLRHKLHHRRISEKHSECRRRFVLMRIVHAPLLYCYDAICIVLVVSG